LYKIFIRIIYVVNFNVSSTKDNARAKFLDAFSMGVIVPFMINIVNCCHAMDLHCLYMFLNVMGTLGCLELRFLHQKYDFCTSGLMNVRLSVHRSLKRTKRREESPVRLLVRLSLQPQHNIFEKFPCGPEMPFEARFLQTFIELRTPQF